MTQSDRSKQPANTTSRSVRRSRLPRATAHALAAMGRASISIGALVLLFVVYQLWGTAFQEAQAQRSLRDQFERQLTQTTITTTVPTTAPSAIVETTEAAPTTTIEVQPSEVLAAFRAGDAIARIRVPKIDLDKIVVEGVEVDDLRKGPGHYRSTPLPGQRGNAAIAGHRTTYGAPFNRIDELEPGDDILVSTLQGDFTYKVLPQTDGDGAPSGHLIVSPNDAWVLDDTDDNRLTLTSCHPKYSASQRIIVQAALVVPPALTPKLVAKPSSDTGRPPVETLQPQAPLAEPALAREDLGNGLGGDPSQRVPALFWGLMVAAFMVAIGRSTRRWGRLRSWAIATLPLLLVVFVFFGHLDRMLPAR